MMWTIVLVYVSSNPYKNALFNLIPQQYKFDKQHAKLMEQLLRSHSYFCLHSDSNILLINISVINKKKKEKSSLGEFPGFKNILLRYKSWTYCDLFSDENVSFWYKSKLLFIHFNTSKCLTSPFHWHPSSKNVQWTTNACTSRRIKLSGKTWTEMDKKHFEKMLNIAVIVRI